MKFLDKIKAFFRNLLHKAKNIGKKKEKSLIPGDETRELPLSTQSEPLSQDHTRKLPLANETDNDFKEFEGSTSVFSKFKQRFSKKAEQTDETRTFVPVPSNGSELPALSDSDLRGSGKEASTIFKRRSGRPNFVLSVILTTIKVTFVAIFAFVALGGGAVCGLASAYLETTPVLNMNLIEDQSLTSYIYDCNGEEIATFTGLENRDWASLDEIPLLLQQAIISVEDVRFYDHNGVDFRRIAGVFISNLTSDTVQGGSTITQQLVKNQLLSSERSYKRKIQEASLAMELEKNYSKDQILEAYLNSIPLGGTNYGVKAAAKDYFGKELDELTLREIACLAGITRYPFLYNPRTVYYGSSDASVTAKRKIQLNDRITTVLDGMYNAGYITLAEAREAINDTFEVKEESSVHSVYDNPHFVEYAIDDVITHLLKQRNLTDNKQNRQAVENELRTQGYHIYTTLDPEIQETVQTTIAEYKSFPKLKNSEDSVIKQSNSDGSIVEIQQPQAACVVLDHTTGELKAIVGSRTEPTSLRTLNRASDNTMPVGSSIKPIAVYTPAFDIGYSPATVIANIATPIDGWNTETGHPKLTGTAGPVSIRLGTVKSWNVVAARTLMEYVGVETSANYLLQMGVDPTHISKDGSGLSMGTSGLSPIEMAGCYATIANGGEYLEPLAFRQVVDSKGNVILDADNVRETRQVFKPSSAYMMIDVLIEAVESGTGRRAQVDGMTIAGKTGTNMDNRGVFFAGFSPYYTQTLWIGHDQYKELAGATAASNATAPLWSQIMAKLVEGKEDKAIMPGDPEDYGLVRGTVCSVSGLKPKDGCPTITDYFAAGTVPTETCNMHVSANICTVGQCTAGPYCPEELVESGSGITIPSDSPYAKLSHSQLLEIFPNLITGITVTDEDTEDTEGTDNTTTTDGSTPCPIHTKEWADQHAQLPTYVAAAQSEISRAQDLLSSAGSRLTSAQQSSLNNQISQLQTLISDPYADINAVDTATKALRDLVDSISSSLPSEPDPSPSESPEPSDSPEVSPSPTE